MNNLEQLLTRQNPQEIVDAIYEQGISVVVDWRGEDEDIVFCFSEKVQGQLRYEWTPNNDILIRYKDKSAIVGLQQEIADRDRTLHSVRDILLDDYEIRVLKRSLDSDTFEFVIEERHKWRKWDEDHGELINQLFTPFTDAVRFGD